MTDTSHWDSELIAMAYKYTPHIPFSEVLNPIKPIIPEGIKFPMLMVLYRKKISIRNSQYLVALPLHSFNGINGYLRNLKHKGWGIKAMTLKLDPRLKTSEFSNRMIFYKYQNWDELSKIVSKDELCLIPELKRKFPCPEQVLKDKKGQFKIIM